MNKKILAVDDSPAIRELLSHILGSQYEVTIKENGMDALEWMHSGNIPDLIIADINMPKVDGQDFLMNVKSSGFFKEIPVIILSGLESSSDRIKYLKMGAEDYMVKPFNPEELSIRIERLFERLAVK